MKQTRFAQESAAQAESEKPKTRTRQEKAWSLAQMIAVAVGRGDKGLAIYYLDVWADDRRGVSAWLDQALNEGDGTYKP